MANPMENSNIHVGEPNPWQTFENNWLWHQYDNFVNGGLLYQNMAPGEAQYSEWSQQMVGTMYQNWYNSAPEQMKRALAAGINPFVAASGIAGNGAGSVASAPAPSNTSSLPNLIGSAAQGLSAVGGSFGAVASGVAALAKLRSEINNIDQNTASEFEKMGFTSLQSRALSTQLKYLDIKEQIGVWQALANYDKTKQEYQNLVATHSNIIAQYDEIIAHKDLLIQEQGEVAAREQVNKASVAKLNAESSWRDMQNQFFKNHGYVLGSPVFESIRDMMVSDGTFDMAHYGSIIAGYNGIITSAVESSKAAASWDYRPSNVSEAAAYIGSHLGLALRDTILSLNGSSSWSEFSQKLRTNAVAQKEFNDSYNDTKEDLYENYLAKKRYYRHIKRGGNSIEVARAKNAMDTAKQEYESLTRERFGLKLLSELSVK